MVFILLVISTFIGQFLFMTYVGIMVDTSALANIFTGMTMKSIATQRICSLQWIGNIERNKSKHCDRCCFNVETKKKIVISVLIALEREVTWSSQQSVEKSTKRDSLLQLSMDNPQRWNLSTLLEMHCTSETGSRVP